MQTIKDGVSDIQGNIFGVTRIIRYLYSLLISVTVLISYRNFTSLIFYDGVLIPIG